MLVEHKLKPFNCFYAGKRRIRGDSTVLNPVSRKKGLTSARRNISDKKVKDLECFTI